MLRLTKKEKLVFYGLIRWPELNDIELSMKINVSRSTITTIRRKLDERKLYSTLNIPDLTKIGCDLLLVSYSNFVPSVSYRIRKEYSDILMKTYPELFFEISTNKRRVYFSAGRNFTEIKRSIDNSGEIHVRQELVSERRNTYVYFPLNLTELFRFFDYAPLLKHHFHLEIDDGYERKTTRAEMARFTENEKLVFYTMVKYPGLTGGQIARRVSMSRQTVNAMKNRFLSDGLLRTVRIPDIRKLGFELMVFSHMHFNPKKPIDKRHRGIELMLSKRSQILKISGNSEAIVLSVFENYTEYLETYDELLDFYERNRFLLGNPVIRIFPIKSKRLLMDMRYAPLVKKVLGIERDI